MIGMEQTSKKQVIQCMNSVYNTFLKENTLDALDLKRSMLIEHQQFPTGR